jgi:hypothetical protein
MKITKINIQDSRCHELRFEMGTRQKKSIVTHIPFARKRLGKETHNNYATKQQRTSIARQRTLIQLQL